MTENYVALLRGINVGGKNKLPMKGLIGMFVDAGCDRTRSYIQSGNVIFRAEPSTAARIPEFVAEQIANCFGYRTPVLLRTEEQIRNVLYGNPFIEAGVAEETLHVLFLADRPSSGAIDRLDPRRSAPDEFAVRGQEIYLRLPHGAARTKLTNGYFDSKLSTVSTGRNWRTVAKLVELMKQVD